MASGRRAVFLDRDGVLNADAGYTWRLSDLQILPGVPDALAVLGRRGFLRIVVSNQSGVARGFFGVDDVERFHGALRAELRAQLAREQPGTTVPGDLLDDVFYCPHLPDGVPGPYRRACTCRKPEPGLLHEAAQRHGIDLASSYLVGDKDSDILCAQAAGARGVQIIGNDRTPHPAAYAAAPSLAEALPFLR
jgi:D-glycero-D-manno-heptose 1,7-bisphosphate phosphatase